MSFNIIRHKGDAKQAETLKHKQVQREEQLLVPEWGVFVNCAPYDDHFLYADDTPGQSAYMCTCGSPAVVTPPGPQGLFVCQFHATHGVHQTSVVNVKDFEKSAGEVLEPDLKGTRWV